MRGFPQLSNMRLTMHQHLVSRISSVAYKRPMRRRDCAPIHHALRDALGTQRRADSACHHTICTNNANNARPTLLGRPP